MKCPRCNEEIIDNIKFCTKCGVNIQEEKARKAEEERRKQKELEIKQKELEDKKRLEEIRRQEEQKKEEAIKEAEKAEAIKQAKEEGIELEIIDKEPETIEPEVKDFKVKKEPEIQEKIKKEKPKKVKIKKNIFQRLFGKLIFILIIIAIVVGGVYYCYREQLLPEFIQKEVKDFDEKLQNVINLSKEVKDKDDDKKEEPKETETENWEVKPEIIADEIKDLNDKVSIIVKAGKEGLIDNKTGKIILEPKYKAIYNIEYYEIGKTEADKTKGLVVKDVEKYYTLNEKYEIGKEVTTITPYVGDAYYYDHNDSIIYICNAAAETKKVEKTKEKKLQACADIDIVTTDGTASKDKDLPATFLIDFEKSTIRTKGYYDTSKAELVIDCNYDEAYEFSEGYAAVKEKGKAGIIDEDGKEVIELKYNETRTVHNGLAFVKKDGKWGILKVK